LLGLPAADTRQALHHGQQDDDNDDEDEYVLGQIIHNTGSPKRAENRALRCYLDGL
jgi:hypothetical protein